MANHVNTYIRFTGLTPETVSKLKERFEPIEFGTSIGAFFTNVEYTHDFFFEHIGSKWCTLEDYDIGDDYADINVTSAWSYPNKLVESLNQFVAETQEEFKTTTTYEDEMPNFFGAEIYLDGDLQDCVEYDDEEIDDLLCETDEKFAELYQRYSEDDDEEAEEEMYDLKNELIWEMISEKQCELLDGY